eukprot:CAMPEP_0196579152 /NCGR_PEP_ID=MMETSP1081-20130531/17813_1 /TAXON_ID=36882 /ORGANISM="Pyramimonas amylifera, Strain CCMP720" /LENGTH=375 /DNA_ID=CAMNT_0041898625 /DNA_START=343 /DNA_END=1470 /DNA_ORIENTATION=+
MAFVLNSKSTSRKINSLKCYYPRRIKNNNASSLLRKTHASCNRQIQASSSEWDNGVTVTGATAHELPCLLFQPYEIFLPGSRKVLHLYEARFLALLDECMQETGGLFAHLIYHPNDQGDLRLDRTATLCRIELIEREQVGARVELVAEARLQLQDILRLEPYIKGTFREVPTMADPTLYQPSEEETASVMELVGKIRSTLNGVIMLSNKLSQGIGPSDLPPSRPTPGASNTPKRSTSDDDGIEEMLWGHMEISNLTESLKWVEAPCVKLSEMKFPISMFGAWTDNKAQQEVANGEQMPPLAPPPAPLELAERLSFAILQNVVTASPEQTNKLLTTRIEAMTLSCGLVQRLHMADELVTEQMQALRAKVALQELMK